jgi:hypothetical protein
MYTIERDVPLPVPRGNTYPFKDMEVGDSFFVQGLGEAPQRKLRSAIFKARKSLGWQFLMRLDEAREGYRIWRTE